MARVKCMGEGLGGGRSRSGAHSEKVIFDERRRSSADIQEVFQPFQLIAALPQDAPLLVAHHLPRAQVDGLLIRRVLEQDTGTGKEERSLAQRVWRPRIWEALHGCLIARRAQIQGPQLALRGCELVRQG